MFKKIIAAFAALLAATAFAAVDANKASQAELEAIKGIGPVISTLIISERKKSNFKDWNDLVVRVKGVGDKSAEKFSEAGLTVNGATFTGAPMTKADKAVTARATAPAPAPAPAIAPARAASAVKTSAEKAASGVKPATTAVKGTAKEEKDAAKTKAEETKDKRAAKKAEKAELKAEKAAAAASAPAKK